MLNGTLCPRCFRKLSEHLWNNDPLTSISGCPYYFDEVSGFLIPNPGDKLYVGAMQIYAQDLIDLQAVYQAQEALYLTPAEYTTFSDITIPCTQIQAKHIVLELRASALKLITAVGMDLSTFLSYDADSIQRKSPLQTDWYDATLTEKRINVNHIEDLRKMVIVAKWMQLYWNTWSLAEGLVDMDFPIMLDSSVLHTWLINIPASHSIIVPPGSGNYEQSDSSLGAGSGEAITLSGEVALTVGAYAGGRHSIGGRYGGVASHFVSAEHIKLLPDTLFRAIYSFASSGNAVYDVPSSVPQSGHVGTVTIDNGFRMTVGFEKFTPPDIITDLSITYTDVSGGGDFLIADSGDLTRNIYNDFASKYPLEVLTDYHFYSIEFSISGGINGELYSIGFMIDPADPMHYILDPAFIPLEYNTTGSLVVNKLLLGKNVDIPTP